MGLRIRTNVASLNAQRRLGNSTTELQESMSKLASGHRINKAADDAAGLAISSNLRADVRSLIQAKRNALDGVSLVQTAEGGLVESTNMLIRMRELSIQAATDTLGDRERQIIQLEYGQLLEEIDRIANTTEFNDTKLLVGNGANAPDGFNAGNPMPLEIQVGKDYHPELDNEDTDNPVNIIRVDLSEMSAYGEDLGIGKPGEDDTVNTRTRENAQTSITRLDGALEKIADYRSYLGAVQNRLVSGINNLSIQVENLQAAKSRILDTDFAAETANMTQANIMQKAGTSTLATANVQPNVALSLLERM